MASKRTTKAVAQMKLPASLKALRDQAEQMFEKIDYERAQLFVQQVANSHCDDDVFLQSPTETITYGDRRKYLDKSERNLRENLPQSVLKALTANE